MKKDLQGREIIGLHEVRGALVTATVTVSSGTAASLISGDTDYFLDIVELSCANNSSVSASVTLINDGTTIRTLQVGSGNTNQFKFDVPLRQSTKNTPWNVDMEDITGTSITIDAVLIKK